MSLRKEEKWGNVNVVRVMNKVCEEGGWGREPETCVTVKLTNILPLKML